MSGKRKAAEAGLDGATDWNTFAVADLKAELGQRNLPKNGKKSDLVQRLKDDDAGAPVGQHEAPSESAPTKKPATKATKAGYSALSATKLKEECTARGISTGGNKADLVERLEDDDAEKALLADPSYVPRRDEGAIATGEERLKAFQPRPDSDFKERYKKAVSLNHIRHEPLLPSISNRIHSCRRENE